MRLTPRIVLPILAAALLLVSVAHAKLARTGDAQVTFTASGPAGMSIVGTTPELAVAETDQEIVVTVPLRNLDTKIELRNKHMREKYLEVGKYPNAELRLAKSAVAQPTGKAAGTLTLHGQSHPLSVTYATKADGTTTAVTGGFRVNMNEYGIEKPGYAGVSVKPEVDVSVTFRVTRD